jgi:hypothetical protein
VVRTARRAQERGWANNAADLKLNVMAPALSLCIRGRMETPRRCSTAVLGQAVDCFVDVTAMLDAAEVG